MTEVPPLEDQSPEELLAEAKENLEEIRSMLRERLDAYEISPIAKIPYKARILREVLLHRVWDLGDAALQQFEKSRNIPAFTLARSTFETASVIFCLYKRIQLVVETNTLGDLDEEFLMRTLFGRKDDPDAKYQAINILTAIDHLDKYIADGNIEQEGKFREYFDGMCEYAHPNWEGTLTAYHHYISERMCEVGVRVGSVPVEYGIYCLRMSLNIGGGFAQKLEYIDARFREICEREMSLD